MSIIAGALKADKGSILFNGRQAVGHPRVFAEEAAYVPQENPLMEELTEQKPSQKKEKMSTVLDHAQVLVVEDNEINRLMLSELLSPEYTVLEAENGQQALEVLEKRKDEISLILLDITMPVMDGYTFLSIAKPIRPWPPSL